MSQVVHLKTFLSISWISHVKRESSVCGDSIASLSSRCFLKLCFKGSLFSGCALKFLNSPSAVLKKNFENQNGDPNWSKNVS